MINRETILQFYKLGYRDAEQSTNREADIRLRSYFSPDQSLKCPLHFIRFQLLKPSEAYYII